MFASFMKWLGGERRPVQRRTRLSLEALEDRMVPSVNKFITVAGSSANEMAPATASAANGMKVVVWAEEAAQGNHDIKAKLYNVNGNQVGPTIELSSGASDDQQPDVSMDAKGNFVAVWTRYYAASKDYDVISRHYSSTGKDLGAWTVASSSAQESDAHVAMNATGEYVVSYTSYVGGIFSDVLAKRYDAQAKQLGATIKVAALTDRYEYSSRIDRADGGRFAISYLRTNGPDETLFLKRYAGNGTLLSKNKIAVGGTPFSSVSHDVGMDNAGNCIVVFDTGALGDSDTISFRRVTKDGVVHAKHPLTNGSNLCHSPAVAVNRQDGDFVLGFISQASGSPTSHALVWELSKNGALKVDQLLIADTSGAAVSIDALDRYFVAYEHAYSATDYDVLGAFGKPS